MLGDLSLRGGHPGDGGKGPTTEVRDEAPMDERFDYAPDLRSIGGGRADFAMEFEHYEEVPSHSSKAAALARVGAAATV